MFVSEIDTALNETFNEKLVSDSIEMKNIASLWPFIVVFYVCVALATTIGNGLVIYATHITIHGHHLDANLPKISGCLINTIQSLAIADLLYGSLGTSSQLYNFYLCKQNTLYYNVKDVIT